MTHVDLAASPSATVLATVLASEKLPPVNVAYRGALTPVELDVRQSEIEALISGAAVHDLGWLRRMQVRGEDRFRWLSGMVTNTVNDLAANAGAWNLVLNAQGRIQGDLTVWRGQEGLELEIAADQAERLLAHLDHFIIMDDVELLAADPGGESALGETALGVTGPKAGEVLQRLGLPVLSEAMTQAQATWSGVDVLVRRGYGVLAEHYALWIAGERAGRALEGADRGRRPAGRCCRARSIPDRGRHSSLRD